MSPKRLSFISTRFLWTCLDCRKQFSVKVGTIFEDSPIPLNKWFCAMWLIANGKNGISSYEVARALKVTQQVRHAPRDHWQDVRHGRSGRNFPLHEGVRYEERGWQQSPQAARKRANRLIRELRRLGCQVRLTPALTGAAT